MQIFRDLESVKHVKDTIITNGTFDGVHLGHQKVLKSIIQQAKEIGLQSTVITFWPHPRYVLNPNTSFQLITTIEERISLLEQLGVDILVIIPFSNEFSQISAKEYIDKVLIDKLGVKKFVIGYDHRFGKNREGDFDFLANYGQSHGFEVKKITEKSINENTISSTKIREAIVQGDMKTVRSFLGRPYALSGTVVQGDKIGREIGYRTANIGNIDKRKLIPCNGVYAVIVHTNRGQHYAMLNIGTRPTIHQSDKVSIEAHIFDFEEEIYEENISVLFIERIRGEQKFDSLEELTEQLDHDKAKAMKALSL